MKGFTKREQAVIDRAHEIIAESMQTYDVTLTSPDASTRLIQLRLAGKQREVFTVLFLNAQHQLIVAEDMFQGTLDGAAVYPREVVKRALELNAAAVILGHNHPSGVATPSQADKRITERISAALGLVDIRVLDHVIVAGTESVSFAQDGLL